MIEKLKIFMGKYGFFIASIGFFISYILDNKGNSTNLVLAISLFVIGLSITKNKKS